MTRDMNLTNTPWCRITPGHFITRDSSASAIDTN
jgi:hypothetical protein